MTELLLFHHALGLTAGCHAFADKLRAAGHVVHTPDLYGGRTFTDLEEGVAFARQLGFQAVLDSGRRAADSLPASIAYAGFSLGVMPAQMLAQTRPGALGALLLHSCVPLSEFGGLWPPGTPLHIHVMEDDAWGDVDVARDIARTLVDAQLFLYPGDSHLFSDNSLPDYDEDAAALLMQRVLAFLRGLE